MVASEWFGLVPLGDRASLASGTLLFSSPLAFGPLRWTPVLYCPPSLYTVSFGVIFVFRKWVLLLLTKLCCTEQDSGQ